MVVTFSSKADRGVKASSNFDGATSVLSPAVSAEYT